MVYIVTGEVNAGKTARMKELFLRRQDAADGILSEKIFDGGIFLGYRLIRLRSGEAMPLALLEKAFHGQFSEGCRLGSFVFSAEAFRFGTETMKRLCADPTMNALFLDEAGPLELGGQGFADILPMLLRAGKDIYITVRSSCLQEFLEKYPIEEYRLISV